MVKLTKEQEKAIKESNKNILLSAAAGSGKTFVLSKRIVYKIILERTNITDYLLLTFTDNAAKEMKVRIKREIENELICAKKENNEAVYIHLLDQLSRIDDADISTIHSFCLKIIRDNITKSNLAPGFTIIDETKNNNLQRDVLEEILDEEFANPSESFDRLVFLLDKKYNKSVIINQIIQIYSKLRALSDIETRIDFYKKYYSNNTNDIIKDLFFEQISKDLEVEILEDIKFQEKIVTKLFEIITKFHKEYSLRKIEINKIDFSDMEQICLRILSDDDINIYYKNNYKEILIDEYQDISDIQETIISKISKDNNLFMVGDVKQSIYKFRNAKPELFIQKLNSYVNSNNDTIINLSNNFRSRNEILEGCNTIFEACFNSSASKITFDKDSRFKISNKKSDYSSEHKINNLIITIDNKSKDKKSIQAKIIVNIINDILLNKYVIDKKTNKKRRAKFEDIAILCDRRSEFNDIQEALNEFDIDSVINDDVKYFQEPQIRTIINFLSILDNPFQDIPLASVMISPFGGFDITEITKIKMDNIDNNLYDACMKYINGNSNSLKNKLEQFISFIDKYRKEAKVVPIYLLLMNLLEESGYIYYLKGLSNSELHLKNIDMLIEKAYKFEDESKEGIHKFIKYIDYVDKYNIKERTADSTNTDVNKVKITTIHASKGMEYPIVILPFLNRDFSRNNRNKPSFEYNEKLGIAFKNIDSFKKIEKDSPIYERIEEYNKYENKEEKIRLLYVAITRAKEYLYLISMIDNNKTDSKNKKDITCKWENAYDGKIHRFSDEYFKKASSYMDLICPIALDKSNSNIFNNQFITSQVVDENNNKLKEEINSKTANLDSIKGNINSTYDDTIEVRLKENEEFIYKYKHLNQMSNKLSVSQIKKDTVKLNDYKGFTGNYQQGFTGLKTGLVYHKVLEKINYKEILLDATIEDIAKKIDEIEYEGFISEEERKIIDDNRIYNMISSDIGGKIIRAAKEDKIYREQKFMMAIPSKYYYKDIDTDEQIIIQGVIDLFIEEEDNIILIDFKSDKSNDKKYYIDNYSIQLEYYQKAIERILDKKVKEKYIYSFEIGEFLAL